LVTRQKKTFFYREAKQEKREQFLEEIKNIKPEDLVYSDEAGIDDNEASLLGWSPKGERCYATKNAERSARYNIIAALNLNKLIAPFVFEGYSNTHTYATYVERVLVPVLRPGMVLVIDNASFHKSKRIIKLVESAGCRVLFLPPYSPDFNPIEHHWSSVKKLIRKVAEGCNNFLDAAVRALAQLCAI
jgi:transposase